MSQRSMNALSSSSIVSRTRRSSSRSARRRVSKRSCSAPAPLVVHRTDDLAPGLSGQGSMTTLDWLAVAVAALAALAGLRRGLVVSLLSLAGVALGAVVGGRLAPLLLPGGESSPYTPLVALAGALTLAFLLEGAGALAGGSLRGALPEGFARSSTRPAGSARSGHGARDRVGARRGRPPGAWSAHAPPGGAALRRAAPPERDRPAAHGAPGARAGGSVPGARRAGGDRAAARPAVLARPGVRRAVPSVVRVFGTACGLGIAGSGWVAGDGLVVTAAHVVAGESDTTVAPLDGSSLPATVVWFDATNDVAVLNVNGLDRPALRLAEAQRSDPVAILGYPGDGPFVPSPDGSGRRSPCSEVTRREAGAPDGDRVSRGRAARRLGRAGRERGRRGRDDRLRSPRGERLRATACRPRSSARRSPPRTGRSRPAIARRRG